MHEGSTAGLWMAALSPGHTRACQVPAAACRGLGDVLAQKVDGRKEVDMRHVFYTGVFGGAVVGM